MHNLPPPTLPQPHRDPATRPYIENAELKTPASLLPSMDLLRRRSDSTSTSGSTRPSHQSPAAIEAIRHRRKMSKRRERAVQAARTERLSDDVAALQSDILHLQQHLRGVEMKSHSSRNEAVATTELPLAESSDPGPRGCPSAAGDHPFFSDKRASDVVEGSAEDTAAAAAQLRHFVVRFQFGWTSNMLTDLSLFVHENVEIVNTDALTKSSPIVSGEHEGGLRGLETKWRRCCETTRGFHMALQQLVPLDPPREWLLSIDLSVQLTREALKLSHPHVVQTTLSYSPLPTNANEIVAKLVAAPLHLNVQCHVWLDGDFKIVKSDTVVGWAAALLACLGNPDDVVWVLTPPRPRIAAIWCI